MQLGFNSQFGEIKVLASRARPIARNNDCFSSTDVDDMVVIED